MDRPLAVRSLGISTGTADLVQWENLFGVDMEQIDQFEIADRGKTVSEAEIETYLAYIERYYGQVLYNSEERFTREHLKKMISRFFTQPRLKKSAASVRLSNPR